MVGSQPSLSLHLGAGTGRIGPLGGGLFRIIILWFILLTARDIVSSSDISVA